MAEASLRAARAAAKGGLPNVLFAVAAAERPPAELCGRIDEITILFPWGSLLRGALGLDPAVAEGIASLVAPGGRVEVLLSVTDRDAGAVAVPPLSEHDGQDVARRWRGFGLELTDYRPATEAEIAGSGSTWARRLRAAGRQRDRMVWRLGLRCGGALDGTIEDRRR
jgi:16S rRNA (adenine(1408)-N(1))-methyltransferase